MLVRKFDSAKLQYVPCSGASPCPSDATTCRGHDGPSSIADTSRCSADSTSNTRRCRAEAFVYPALLLWLLDCLLCRCWNRFLLTDGCHRLFGCDVCDGLLRGCCHGFLLHRSIDRLLRGLNSRRLDRRLLHWCFDWCLLRRGRDGRLLGADGLRDHGETLIQCFCGVVVVDQNRRYLIRS